MMEGRTRMIVGSDGDAREILRAKPKLDLAATATLAERLFPGEPLEPMAGGSLSFTAPHGDQLILGAFPCLFIVAAEECGPEPPSALPARFLDPSLGRTIYLHAMFPELDALAFAVWQDGKLQRSLSLSLEDGIFEDIGEPLAFELPFWQGRRPRHQVEEDPTEYPLNFDPIELGDEALLSFFGYRLVGERDPSDLNPESIPLLWYRRSAR